ncbi:hypothetical protein BC830DRAFT_203740 [Chytriomyces sp. MP71]|nr:hypothetical protein BC830DRAFT_203740 [Chytriomyces sp. MP71]
MFESESAPLWIATCKPPSHHAPIFSYITPRTHSFDLKRLIVAAAFVSHLVGFTFLCPNVLTRWLQGSSSARYERVGTLTVSHGLRSTYSFIFDLVRSYVHLHLLLAFSSFSTEPLHLPQALYTTGMIWLAYTVPVFASDSLWEGRSVQATVYSSARHLVTLYLSTLVIFALDTQFHFF